MQTLSQQRMTWNLRCRVSGRPWACCASTMEVQHCCRADLQWHQRCSSRPFLRHMQSVAEFLVDIEQGAETPQAITLGDFPMRPMRAKKRRAKTTQRTLLPVYEEPAEPTHIHHITLPSCTPQLQGQPEHIQQPQQPLLEDPDLLEDERRLSLEALNLSASHWKQPDKHATDDWGHGLLRRDDAQFSVHVDHTSTIASSSDQDFESSRPSTPSSIERIIQPQEVSMRRCGALVHSDSLSLGSLSHGMKSCVVCKQHLRGECERGLRCHKCHGEHTEGTSSAGGGVGGRGNSGWRPSCLVTRVQVSATKDEPAVCAMFGAQLCMTSVVDSRI
mmetsp:Transcript_91035/g.181001  ORF Transcript_91035/g.181001 Transcript_91035/m.181001 type:complete len:331 (+) Transcript_91035:1547-2539(+)